MPSIQPTHMQYNIDVYNIDNSNNGSYQLLGKPCNYVENRADSFLEYPDDYELTVLSFNIDNNSLPIQVVQPQIGSTLTSIGYASIFEITVSSLTVDTSPLPIFWKPADTTLQLNQTITANDYTNEYFWNYNIQYFLELLNNTIRQGVLIVNPAETLVPYFFYDSSISRITFSAPASWITDAQGVSVGYTLKINDALYALLGGFPYIRAGTPKGYYSLIVPDTFTNRYNQSNSFTAPTTSPYVRITQSYNTVQNWNPISSITFLSPVVPVVNDMIAEPLIFSSNTEVQTKGDVLNVLFDFVVSIRDNPETSFQPLGQFAFTSLFGKHPVSELQVITKWRDSFGNLYPLKLEYGSSFEMKILFRKKEFTKKIW